MTTFAYSTYLTLVNDLLTELNEVPLTSGNFAQAVGFQSVAKHAVNKAIRYIQNQQWEWPYNHQYTTQILTPGVSVYALPDNCRSVDWDTFFCARDDTLPSPQRGIFLPEISYDRYAQRYKQVAVAMDSSQWTSPQVIFRTQQMEFGVYPPPDQAYTIDYEYWKSYSGLSTYGDLSTVPNLFDYVVNEGGMYYCYRFRENLEAATEAYSKFQDGIKVMRDIYINDFLALTDTRPSQNTQVIF